MRLFIAEKPSLAKAIAAGLGSAQSKQGYISCANNNLVTWCYGHLFELAMPEDYGFKKWNFNDLPIVPKEWKNKPRQDKGVKSQIQTIGKLIKDAAEVVNAGDPDREGQLLVDEVLEHFNCKKKVSRIWLASLDPKSVKKALSRLESNSKYAPLRDSADARSKADWLVGMNMSRAMTLAAQQKAGVSTVLSVGRVQTPTLAIIVDRDRTIENFVPQNYFVPSIKVKHKNGEFDAVWMPRDDAPHLDNEKRITKKEFAQELVDKAKNQPGKVVKASYTSKKKPPPLPHKLSTLQKEASSKFQFSAKKTLQLAQSLYEKQMTSYPRTDCQYLPDEQFEEAGRILSALKSIGIKGAEHTNSSLKSKAWDTKKVGAHHAIIPTGQNKNMTEDEQKMFSIIAKFYMYQFMPDMEYIDQQVVVLVASEHWKATGKEITKKGWTTF